MSKFVEALAENTSYTRTENGALAYRDTGSNLVNLFGQIGSLRPRSEEEIQQLFSRAFGEDKLLATKMSFYARDIRSGGLGERNTPRVIWKWLATTHPEVMKKNLAYVPVFGRWDDMYAFVGTPCEKAMWKIVKKQFADDIAGMLAEKPISLLAKWLKSPNTSSVVSRRLGVHTANCLGLTVSNYRKTLAKMRKYLDVVEHKMSYQLWNLIEYPAVPSYAMKNYRKAFARHDEVRFQRYLDSLQKGETKINAATLFPYDITLDYLCRSRTCKVLDVVLEEQWKALPDYIGDSDRKVLIMCDTSGSMFTAQMRPIATALGLSIYFGERIKGEFHNKFLTFSARPALQTIVGDTLQEKMFNLSKADWDCNTNLEAAFDLVLATGIQHNLTDADMPDSIVVISDNQIDAPYCNNTSFYKGMKRKFESHGFKMPQLVFWNVESRRDTFHARAGEEGVFMASGQSPSVFSNLLNTVARNPYDFMLEVLGKEVYNCITV